MMVWGRLVAGAEAEQPWNNSKCMELAHSSWSTVEDYKAAMRCTTCVAATVNCTADRLKLPNGGYGYLGVCNDSVAMVQASLQEEVTLFPCILAGGAKTILGSAIKVRDCTKQAVGCLKCLPVASITASWMHGCVACCAARLAGRKIPGCSFKHCDMKNAH
jgi:hypothetical protein